MSSTKTQDLRPKILFIVGPTASGKSSLAMKTALQYDGEIICADSQTIRKELDVGTAKPSKEDQKTVMHYMLDIIGPYDSFSAAEFKRHTESKIEEIKSRGKLPIVVGGTGLYIDAILFNFSFKAAADTSLRTELNKKSVPKLQQIIKDEGLKLPENSQNPRHLIRVIESAGQQPTKESQREDAVVVGIDPGKEKLLERIATRVESMFASGFVEEAEEITNKYGVPPEKWDAIGYKIVLQAKETGSSEAETKQAVITAHKQYAKRQRAWFKRNKNITWFEQPKDALSFIEKQLQSS